MAKHKIKHSGAEGSGKQMKMIKNLKKFARRIFGFEKIEAMEPSRTDYLVKKSREWNKKAKKFLSKKRGERAR